MTRLSPIVRHRLFWPAAALVLLLVSNLFFSTDFFAVRIKDGHLYGSLIDILRGSTPLVLVALGMTLVIATAGIDLSVGSVIAIVGAVACLRVSELDDQNSVTGVLAAVAVAVVLSLVLGLWNGVLVAAVGIQPIIATLILLVGGRGIAQLITDGQIINVRSSPYRTIGAGYALTIPVAVIIAAAVVAVAVLLTRRTALGLLIESVGSSPTASRLAGIQARRLTLIVYVFSGFCAGVAGLIYSSNISSADGNNAGSLIELDAILAVVIGGTALTGGRFSIAGSVLGAVLIQTLNITIYTAGVPGRFTLLFKAVVVVVLCLAQSPTFRAKVFGRWRRSKPPTAGPTPGAPAPAEVAA
ncbi:ABC transporter permease [Cryptosporangium arvum]|uniref:Permease component of ribose/xylose/arabinose/galactoside ABC-type transporter n=1 Tax=Cryptosporangium arvum DSM 44712 TaxID=927661 RepID=A0A010Z208_9ACTN|nr:ABC transporter permease [Cryptosporangium arvum]EXG81463.1 permease component of ribose/xylose/arabinose/galactoside ABC-type transporter [Cryptosporangium arvum DSM 44712]